MKEERTRKQAFDSVNGAREERIVSRTLKSRPFLSFHSFQLFFLLIAMYFSIHIDRLHTLSLHTLRVITRISQILPLPLQRLANKRRMERFFETRTSFTLEPE